jgi:hypothetical protein
MTVTQHDKAGTGTLQWCFTRAGEGLWAASLTIQGPLGTGEGHTLALVSDRVKEALATRVQQAVRPACSPGGDNHTP